MYYKQCSAFVKQSGDPYERSGMEMLPGQRCECLYSPVVFNEPPRPTHIGAHLIQSTLSKKKYLKWQEIFTTCTVDGFDNMEYV